MRIFKSMHFMQMLQSFPLFLPLIRRVQKRWNKSATTFVVAAAGRKVYLFHIWH